MTVSSIWPGVRWERLVVMERLTPPGIGYVRWRCLCDCGKETEVSSNNLNRGYVKSCGCLARERRTKSGLGRTVECAAWRQMLARCHRPGTHAYERYGGRGIIVCQEWRLSFQSFVAHVGLRPGAEYSIERIDNNRGYEPGNVRWATRGEQQVNLRSNRLLTLDGVTMPMVVWARQARIPYWRLASRIYAGWNVRDALTRPPRHTGRVKRPR